MRSRRRSPVSRIAGGYASRKTSTGSWSGGIGWSAAPSSVISGSSRRIVPEPVTFSRSAGDVRLAEDLRGPNSDDQLAGDAVALAELLGPVLAHVLRPEEGRDGPALLAIVDQQGFAFDRDVRIWRLGILDDDNDGGVPADVRGLDRR